MIWLGLEPNTTLLGVWKKSCVGFKYLVGKCPNNLSKIPGFVATNTAGNSPMFMKYIWFCWHIYLVIYLLLLKIPDFVITITAGKFANDLSKISGFIVSTLAGNVQICMWLRLSSGYRKREQWSLAQFIYIRALYDTHCRKSPRKTYNFQCICGLQKFYSGGWAESVRLDTDEMTLLDECFFAERRGKWGEAVGEGGGRGVSRKKARFTWQPPARRELWVLPGLKMLRRCQWCAQPGGRKDAADLARGTWLDGCIS